MDATLCVILCLGAIVLLRVQIGYRHDIARINELYAADMKDLDAWKGKGDCPPLRDYGSAKVGLSWSTIFDLRKWTYRQYYPEVLS